VSSESQTFEALRLRSNVSAFHERLKRRRAEAELLPGADREKVWLADADGLIEQGLRNLGALLSQAEKLPELEHQRDNYARAPQQAWVDAVEQLWARISYHLGRRAPILEALFPHTRFTLLRKPRHAVVREYQQAFIKRQAGSYVQRILAEPDSAFALPLLDEMYRAFARWEDVLTGPSLAPEAAEALRAQLRRTSLELEKLHKQARHLLEAAQLGLPVPQTENTSASESASTATSTSASELVDGGSASDAGSSPALGQDSEATPLASVEQREAEMKDDAEDESAGEDESEPGDAVETG
jgi:hypothetical protein